MVTWAFHILQTEADLPGEYEIERIYYQHIALTSPKGSALHAKLGAQTDLPLSDVMVLWAMGNAGGDK